MSLRVSRLVSHIRFLASLLIWKCFNSWTQKWQHDVDVKMPLYIHILSSLHLLLSFTHTKKVYAMSKHLHFIHVAHKFVGSSTRMESNISSPCYIVYDNVFTKCCLGRLFSIIINIYLLTRGIRKHFLFFRSTCTNTVFVEQTQ